MLSGIALKIALGFGLIGAATGAWFYVQTIRAELDAANERTARAMDVVNEQAATLDKLQEDIKLIQNITQELGKKMADAEKSVVDLSNKFDVDSQGRTRDIGKEIIQDPVKWSKKINRATKDALRCNELVTGAQPLPDEVNGQCPDLVPGSLPTKAEEKVDIRKTVK